MSESTPKLTHLESELNKIKSATKEMMSIVKYQLLRGKEALLESNRELALEVMHNEKRVNGYEIMIDNACENVIACFSPVAIDLRFVLASLKINYHLERLGDNAEGIAKNVLEMKTLWAPELIENIQLVKAFELADDMLNNVIESYLTEDTSIARKVFEKDKYLDAITTQSHHILAEYMRNSQVNLEQNLYLLLIHRKIERVGDLIKNIAEEIIFYIEARVLKHLKDSNKKD